MSESELNKKMKELEVIILRIEEKITEQDKTTKNNLEAHDDKINHLKRKLAIFNQLLTKYRTESNS